MNRKKNNHTNNSSESAQRTKALVLKAAIDEFAEFGLAGGRVERIAKRAKVNKQALYYHYGDKDSLFEAALVFGYEKFEFQGFDWQKDQRPPRELMGQILGSFFDLVDANRNHMALISDENRNRGMHLTANVLGHIRAATSAAKEAIDSCLKRGQAAGVFSKEIDATFLYLIIAGFPIFYFNHCYTLSGILRENILLPRKISERRNHFVKFILAALRP